MQELINQVEKILPNSVNEDDTHMYLYTLSMLLRSYNNSREYQEKEQLTIRDKSNKSQRLNFTSKFDKSENNEKLLSFFDTNRGYHSNMHDMRISHLIKKIDITETIVMN